MTPFGQRGGAVLLEGFPWDELAVVVEMIMDRGMAATKFSRKLNVRKWLKADMLADIATSAGPPKAVVQATVIDARKLSNAAIGKSATPAKPRKGALNTMASIRKHTRGGFIYARSKFMRQAAPTPCRR